MKTISGIHVLVDGYVKDAATLDPNNICDLFDELVPALKMQYLMRPVAMRVPLDLSKLSSEDDEGGWSVICQITTSHIALHGWPARKAFMMDVFSCCHFDVDTARAIIWEKLGVDRANMKLIERQGPL